MKNIKRNHAVTLLLDLGETPDADPTVDLTSEWGNDIGTDLDTDNTTGNFYSCLLSSSLVVVAGVNKMAWNYQVSGEDRVKYTYFKVYDPYNEAIGFFEQYPELEDDFGDAFVAAEIKIRGIINTFTGQSFDFMPAQALTFDGTGKRDLYVTTRINSLDGITMISRNITQDNESISEDDVTSLVELNPSSKFFVRYKSSTLTFVENNQYTILGDWGWPYVPQEISDASALLLKDAFDDDSNYRTHMINRIEFDRQRMEFDGYALTSTGNLDADILLLDYMRFGIELI